MLTSVWLLLLIVCIAGGVGGLVNAFINNNGFPLPNASMVGGGRVLNPGFLGNLLIGVVSAAVSWGVYGPLSAASPFTPLPASSFTLSTVVGAVLIGAGGARWLTSEVNRKQLTLQVSQSNTALAGVAEGAEVAPTHGMVQKL